MAFPLPATAPPDQSNELDEEIELVKNKRFYGIHARTGCPMALPVWMGGWPLLFFPQGLHLGHCVLAQAPLGLGASAGQTCVLHSPACEL